MLQKFSTDLTKQEIFANGHELATVMGHDKDEQGNRIYERLDTEEIFPMDSVEKLSGSPLIFEDDYGELKPKMKVKIDSQSRINTLLVIPWVQDEISPTTTYFGVCCYVKGLAENQ